jgi:hypothetical protein
LYPSLQSIPSTPETSQLLTKLCILRIMPASQFLQLLAELCIQRILPATHVSQLLAEKCI